MEKKRWKMVLLWVLGAMCIMFGSMIAGRLEKTIGVTDAGYVIAFTVSFILMLLGGLLWIAVAAAVKTSSD